jgi:hypothetical protein
MLLNNNQEWFYNLRNIAKQDLSQGHLTQHRQTASNVLVLANIKNPGVGCFTTNKNFDDFTIENGVISGRKTWISGIPTADYLTFHDSTGQLFYVDLHDTGIKFELNQLHGMEDTMTGYVTFTNTPIRQLFNIWKNPKIVCLHFYGFLTNGLGLAEGIYECMLNHHTRNEYEEKKLKLQIDTFELLWKSKLTELIETNDHINLVRLNNEFFTMFSYNKKMLLDLCQMAQATHPNHLYNGPDDTYQFDLYQKHKDGLLFSSHMYSFYMSLGRTIQY